MNLAVIGSTQFNDYDAMTAVIDALRQIYDVKLIVSGGAKGADTLGEIYAKDNGIKTLIFPADWDRYGKSAGFRRNVTIWDNADAGVAFWNGVSKGTAHSFKISEKQKKKLYVFDFIKTDFYLHSKLKEKIHNVSIF